MRLEGWVTRRLYPTLRDAILRIAPQGEVSPEESMGSNFPLNRLLASCVIASALLVVAISVARAAFT
jgi:hypothetical protein